MKHDPPHEMIDADGISIKLRSLYINSHYFGPVSSVLAWSLFYLW